MKSIALAAAAFVGFASLAATPSVAAEVRTQYTGATCQPLLPTAQVQRDGIGRTLNTGGAAVVIACPVIRNVTASTSLEFAAVTLQGPINSSCTFATVNGSGALSATSPSAIRPVAGTDRFRLQFADGDANLAAAADRVALFRCTLVPGGSILNYAIVENVNEN